MNILSNIWLHPKTTVAGILIAFATIAGVLSQQGISLGTAGTGTVVTLIAGICTALLGLLAKDPGSSIPSSSDSPAKLGAWVLIALLLQGSLIVGGSAAVVTTMSGCTPAQVENEINTVLQEANGIIAVADPGASWLADFSKATALLKTDEAAWVSGGAVQDVINVLNDLEGVTALISPLVPYAALIGVLVAGIDAVLAALLPAPAASPSALTAHAATPANPFKGKEKVTSAKQSKGLWNTYVAQNPALAKAAI